MTEAAIKVGVIADKTGPLSFVGIANANVARMVIDDINASGGLLGRPARAHHRGQRDHRQRRRGQGRRSWSSRTASTCIFGGIYSSTRQAIKGPAVEQGEDALHLPGAVRGAGVRSADLLHRPGAGAAGRSAHPVADARDRARSKFYLPSADYIWPRVLNRRSREVVDRERRHDRRRGVLPARSRGLPRDRRPRSCRAAPRWCSTRSSRRGSRRSSSSCTTSGFTKRGGQLVCTYFDENFLNMVPAEHVEGLYGCLDYYQAVSDPFSDAAARPVRRALPGRRQVHRRQRVLRPVPRHSSSGRRRSTRRARSSRTT